MTRYNAASIYQGTDAERIANTSWRNGDWYNTLTTTNNVSVVFRWYEHTDKN